MLLSMSFYNDLSAFAQTPISPSGEYFALQDDHIPIDAGQARSLGPWHAQIVNIAEIAPEDTPPLMLIASTDHADAATTDGGLYVWRADHPSGPWSYGGRIFANDEIYRQMESPTARVLIDPADGKKKLFVWAHYVPWPYKDEGTLAHRQVSLVLLSEDGVAPLLPLSETALDAARPEYDLSEEPFNAHLGYLTVGENIFPGLVDPETGEPWKLIGNSMYGSQASSDTMFGMALWGLNTARDRPKLIERSVRDSRFIYRAPTRMITTSDIGATFRDADGTLWGFFIMGGKGGFELRAVELDRWGLTKSRAKTILDGSIVDPTDFPAPFTPAAELKKPQSVTAFRGQNGQIWAVITVVLAEEGLPDTNWVLIVPLGGAIAPEFNTDRPGSLRSIDQRSLRLQVSSPGLSMTPNIVGDGQGFRVTTPTPAEWEVLSWQTERPLSKYEFIRFQIEAFGEAGGQEPPNQSDFWVFATADLDATGLPQDGFFTGADAAMGSDVAFFEADGENPSEAEQDISRYLSIGRGMGSQDWRYDLGIAIWPDHELYGVIHSGDSLIETIPATSLDTHRPWRFGIAMRRGEGIKTQTISIGAIRVIFSDR